MTTSTNNLEELFHLSEMSEDEKVTLLSDIGNLILESATLRFLSESDEGTADHFSRMIDTYSDKNNLHVILIETFPAFGAVLEEEAEAFHEDAKKILTVSNTQI